ncbi:hypothetical protein QQF64_015489 [Cirrhinus molitorella]|uniref:NACHT domain-containing protein n=1 Tax=Cirrhinus molitorella TaxID=172907 RepID=A0ABR3NV27_9TELE
MISSGCGTADSTTESELMESLAQIAKHLEDKLHENRNLNKLLLDGSAAVMKSLLDKLHQFKLDNYLKRHTYLTGWSTDIIQSLLGLIDQYREKKDNELKRDTYLPGCSAADSMTESALVEALGQILQQIGDKLDENLDLNELLLGNVVQPKYKTLSDTRRKYLLPDERVLTHYTEPVLIKRSKEQTEKYCQEYVKSVHASGTGTSSQLLSNDKNHSIRIDQLFSPDCDGNTPKTVILVGDSGCGKSFILEKIMLDWASGELYSENFDAVIHLKFDELKCISEEIHMSELLSWSCLLTLDQNSEILKTTPEKVLYLIDGMDEFSFNPHIQISSPTDPSQKAPIMDILHCLLRDLMLLESSVIVTTRYTAAAELSNLFKRPQRFTEIAGFSERGVQEYFQKFFQDEQVFRKTYESVKSNESLLTACTVPLLCWMVCFCLKKHFTGSDHVMRELKTTTSIYVHFVSTLLEHHDQSQSVLTMLRSLGQLAEEGVKKRQVLFDNKSVSNPSLDFLTNVFLYKGGKHFLKFMHFSFQEFFTALYYVLLDEEECWCKVSELFNLMESEAIIYRSSLIFRGRLSNPMPSVMMFLCGLFNEKASSSLFKKMKSTVPHTIKLKKTQLKKKLMERIPAMTRQYGLELFALHCLYELQDERFVREALKTHNFMDLSNVSLRSTDCCVLLYCLQCCPHIRDLNLMYCDLTAEKLKILQPALCMCENLRLSVEHLSEVGDLIQILGETKILRELKIQEDEYSSESPRWSLDLSVTCGDVSLSLSSSEKNPSFPAVLNISLTFPQTEISNTDWTLILQRLSRAGKVAEDSSALDEHVNLLLSSFHSVGLKMLSLKLVSLNESWASGIISLVQSCTSLQELRVSVTGLFLEEGLTLLKKSLTDPQCTVIIEGNWKNWSHSCNEKVEVHFKPKALEKLEKSAISKPSSSGLNLQPLPVCQSCVHIVDSDQWVHVEPSVCTDEGGSEFRISTPAGRFECSRTRMRWVCAGDVTLQYRAVDGSFLRAELERLQCERIGPVIDVTVISGKLEEAHLPHYACLAESDPSLTDAFKHHDNSQSVLTMLRSLGLLAERAIQNQQVFFDEKAIAETGLDVTVCLFLYNGSLKRKEHVPVFKFMNFSFQEFFTYVLLDDEENSLKVNQLFNLMEWEAILDRPSPDLRERRSNPILPVMLFLYGLLNEEVSSSFLEKIEWTAPHTIKSKKKEMRKTLKRAIVLMIQQYGVELYALHCLHELQDKRFVRKILKVYRSMDLYNISLGSTDCWVLLYCLQCCPHIRDLNLMYCDLIAEKLKILQPALYKRFVREAHNFMDLSNVSLSSTDCCVLLYCLQHCSHIRDLDLTYCDLTTEKLKILQPALCMCESIRLNISKPESSGLNLYPLPVCQSCVHIVDSDQWVQVEPSVCTDEGGSEFRIRTPAGRFECRRTRMRWVCAGDVTLQYRAVDGRFLRAELERLQCERIGPVIDVTVISRKLEEAHLPHYACLPESDPSLKNDARLLSKSHEGISLQSVELTRYHAKIVQPSFSLITYNSNYKLVHKVGRTL